MQASHTWCNGISFKFMPLTIFSNFLKTHHVEAPKSLVQKHGSFIRIFLLNINVEKIQVPFLTCFHHKSSMDIIRLTTIFIKLHFQVLLNEFASRNETIPHFGNTKNLSDGCEQHFASNLHLWY